MSGCLHVRMTACLDVWMSVCLGIFMSGCLYVQTFGFPNVRLVILHAQINHILVRADIGSPMNMGRISDVGRHRLAHDIWVILTVGFPMCD